MGGGAEAFRSGLMTEMIKLGLNCVGNFYAPIGPVPGTAGTDGGSGGARSDSVAGEPGPAAETGGREAG